MITREPVRLPEQACAALRRARRLEWISLGILASIVVVMYLAMGHSQAMKTAWIEDVLSLVPPAIFLACSYVQLRPPTKRFPCGRFRVMNVSFIGAAVTLFGFGAFLFIDAIVSLVRQEHPTVGATHILGYTIWSGWVMIAALVYSVLPTVFLGRLKRREAEVLHDKTLLADAEMNRADWMTGVAAIAGVVGIGAGFWWADSVAAGLIALSVLHDGVKEVLRALRDACDQRPTALEDDRAPHPAIAAIRQALRDLPFVEDADVRLHNEGITMAGVASIVLKAHERTDVAVHLETARRAAHAVTWRLHDIAITVLDRLEDPSTDDTPPDAEAASGPASE